MSSVASGIEKLRAIGNYIKLRVPHTLTNIATGSLTHTTLSFINGDIPSKLALAFVKSARVIGSWTHSPRKFEMFGLTSLVCKVNGIPLYNLPFINPIGPYMN